MAEKHEASIAMLGQAIQQAGTYTAGQRAEVCFVGKFHGYDDEYSPVKVRGSKEAVAVETLVYGWKVLVLIEVQTRLPLAMKVVKIEAYEGQYLVPLVEQAQANLGSHARIVKVVIDRGYLDGEDLWQLDQRGLLFIVVSKSTMAITQDAQALAKIEPSRLRERVVRHGHGRNATTETLRTRLVGIENLTTYDAYGPDEQTKQQNRRDFVGHAHQCSRRSHLEQSRPSRRGNRVLDQQSSQRPLCGLR